MFISFLRLVFDVLPLLIGGHVVGARTLIDIALTHLVPQLSNLLADALLLTFLVEVALAQFARLALELKDLFFYFMAAFFRLFEDLLALVHG